MTTYEELDWTYPASIYLFKDNYGNTRTMCGICSLFTTSMTAYLGLVKVSIEKKIGELTAFSFKLFAKGKGNNDNFTHFEC